jgi:hypothetical protein
MNVSLVFWDWGINVGYDGLEVPGVGGNVKYPFVLMQNKLCRQNGQQGSS